MNKRFHALISAVALAAMLLAACGGPATTQAPTSAPPTTAPPTSPPVTTGGIDCMGAKSGDTISMVYQWSGAEEARLQEILKPLVDACGIVLQPEASRDQAILDTKVQAGTPPDIAFWNVTQLVQYKDKLVPMDALGGHKENYASFFTDPGTIDGEWLGLPVKADIKTIIWYSPVVFEAKGYTVPATWAELDALVEESLKKAALWDEVKDKLHHSALALSGGQQQRLCIARALAVEPEVLLLDEPCSALDPIATGRIEELLLDLKKNYTMVIVTHNMQQAARVSDTTAFFMLGQLVEFGSTSQIFTNPRDKVTEDYITGRFG